LRDNQIVNHYRACITVTEIIFATRNSGEDCDRKCQYDSKKIDPFFHIFLPVIKFKKPCTGRPFIHRAEWDAVHAPEYPDAWLTSSAFFDLFSWKYIQKQRLRGCPAMSSSRKHKTAGVFPRCTLPAPIDFTDERRSRWMCGSVALRPAICILSWFSGKRQPEHRPRSRIPAASTGRRNACKNRAVAGMVGSGTKKIGTAFRK